MKLEELPEYLSLCYKLQQIDEAYKETLGITTGKETLSKVTEAVCKSGYTTEEKEVKSTSPKVMSYSC